MASLYNELLQDSYLTQNDSHLSGVITLGNLKLNIDWHSVTICTSLVLNNFWQSYKREGDCLVSFSSVFARRAGVTPVAAISSEWWGVGDGVPSGVQGHTLVRGSEGHSPPEAVKKLNFDNTKPL